MQLTKLHPDLDEFLSSHFALGRRRLMVDVIEAFKDPCTFSFDGLQLFLDALARHQIFKGL